MSLWFFIVADGSVLPLLFHPPFPKNLYLKEVLTYLIEHCQTCPSVSSAQVQRAIVEHFGSAPSVGQLNRVRARLGLSRQPVPREKKASSGFLP